MYTVWYGTENVVDDRARPGLCNRLRFVQFYTNHLEKRQALSDHSPPSPKTTPPSVLKSSPTLLEVENLRRKAFAEELLLEAILIPSTAAPGPFSLAVLAARNPLLTPTLGRKNDRTPAPARSILELNKFIANR